MAIEWSGLSPELLVRLDRSAPEPLRTQLEASLREAIRGRRLRAGERLPSSRELAHDLGVSRGMVQDCYGQLLAEGYLTSRTGSATRVADLSGPAAGQREASHLAAAGQPATGSAVGSPAVPALSRRPAEPPLIANFQPGVPDLSSFPRTDWAWAVKQACTEVAATDLGYGDPRGSAVLREVLAGYLRRVRAAAASPAQMIISTGFAQGVNLVLRALARERGVTRVAFEDPGYGSPQDDETVRAALSVGLDVSYVPVDEQGLVVGELVTSGAQVVVVTPAHQSPTGVVLSPARRHALTDWTRQGGYVIEDDYDSEFRYDSEPVGVLQGLAPDQVFLLGTASKSLAPAVRLGWVHAPAPLAPAVAAREGDERPRLVHAGPARPGHLAHHRPVRPSPAADAHRLRCPPHRADRHVRPARPAGPAHRARGRIPGARAAATRRRRGGRDRRGPGQAGRPARPR